MGKLSRKRKSVEETLELDRLADTLEDEIIDLVDPVEETAAAPDDRPADDNLETIETNLDLFLVEGEELDDTLDEELMGVNVGDNKGTPTHKNDADLHFEESLVEMFETTELLAAKLLGESSQTEEEESLGVGEDPQDDGNAQRGLAARATDETAGTGEVIESEDELPENLFVNLEPVKEAPGKKNGATAVDAKPEATSDKTNWVDSSRYYPLAVQAIDRKISEYEQEIEKLVAKKEQLKNVYVHLRSILYLEGEELRKAVLLILAKYWSLKLFFLNKTKGVGFNENILIRYNGRRILAKIKSTPRVSPSHKFITQMWQDLHYSGLGAKADGALIINYNTGTDPKDRNLAYADEDEDQLDDLIFIDTRVLYKLTTAIIDGHISVEEGKKILFKKGRVEF
ncbi:MAG: hypothetical protein LJE87_16240 [Deltaproteobacteria bacterium]|nr:hypothetical protein [Deltaproteobacteria bacterium]